MKLSSLFFCLSLIFLVSCSTDDAQQETNTVDEEPQEVNSNFYALTVGNTWTYENFYLDFNTGEYNSRGRQDIITITGTTILNDNEFFVFESEIYNELGELQREEIFYQRDSLGYLIDGVGNILFSTNIVGELYTKFNLRDENNEVAFVVEGTLIINNRVLDLEAGLFYPVVNEYYATQGNNENPDSGREYVYYADGIGLLQYDISTVTSFPHYREMRLKSYTVN